ncbi:ABC transporter substrate-binding protein [Cohnella sp. GCM10020058]|uniref:ABC transporter substrate-binding protein n=1 Tax=Cohnella sp. GCM10020058 TaxID=3317330 RepID=UPI00363ED0E7
MNNKKKGLAFSLLTMMLVATACGGNNNGNAGASASSSASASPSASASASDAGASSPAASTEAPKITMTIQYPKPDNTESIALEDSRIKRFEEKYPNVTIKKNDWQYAPSEIGIKMAAHQAQAAFNTFATEGKTLSEHQWAADLTSLMAGYEHANDFNEKLLGPMTIGGKLYALPYDGYIMNVMINKKLFQDKNVPLPTADWTWDDFYNAAKATADPAKGIAGFAIMAKGNEGGWNWTNFLYQAGGTAENVADGKVTSAFNSDAGVKAMEFLKKLRWEANALPQNWALNYNETYNLFKQGRAAMVIGQKIEDSVNQAGMKKEDLMVLPMPSMEKGGDHVGVMGGNYRVINPQESPEVQQAAFNYLTLDYFNQSGLDELKRILDERKANNQVYFWDPTSVYYNIDSDYGSQMKDVLAQYSDTVFTVDDQAVTMMKGEPEATYNAQDYYGAITTAMQAILSDKNADPKAELDKAAKKFDTEVLSKIKVE